MDVSSISADALRRRLQDYLNQRGCGFSIGTRGALAEFRVEPDDEPAGAGLTVATAGGAIALDPPAAARAIGPQAVPSGDGRGAVEVVLPGAEARMAGRRVVTEVGPDRRAVREADRDAVLFDLGLGLPFVDVAVRIADPATLGRLRRWCGRGLAAVPSADLEALKRSGPHRVFASRIGRIEVYQPIPAAHERSPPGPHTHLHPARVPPPAPVGPAALVSCLTVYPRRGPR